MAYILVDDDNRVIAISDDHLGDNEIEVTLPDDYESKPFKTYFYENGELLYDNTVYILLDEDNRVLSISEFSIDPEREIAVELPDDLDLSDYENYIYQDGKIVYSEKPVPVYEQIAELKANLERTDYVVIKLSEAKTVGRVLPDEDLERYSNIIIQRQLWREQINELEAKEV